MRAADGHTYFVRAVRVPEGGESPLLGIGSGLAGDLLPGLAGHLADAAGALSMGRMGWGVRVFRRSSRFRPAQLLYGEELETANGSVKRALVLALRIKAADGDIKRALGSEGRLATPPPKRRS